MHQSPSLALNSSIGSEKVRSNSESFASPAKQRPKSGTQFSLPEPVHAPERFFLSVSEICTTTSAMMRLRSTRRQRTTPSFSRSGPASTIVANSANCAADRRGGPSVQLSMRPSGPVALKRWTQSRSGLPIHPADLGRRPPIHPVPHRRQRQQPATLVDVL